MLPNFIHAGAPKSASATFELLFRNHPELYTTRAKEIDFFSNDIKYAKGLGWLEETYFKDTGPAKIVCDMSIGYSTGFGIHVPERILRDLGPEVKFLFTLRHPVDRAYAQYCMARYKGQLDLLPFEKSVERALAMEGRFDEADVARVHLGSYYSNARDMDIFRYCMYLQTGLYARTLEEYIRRFGRERILILFVDDVQADLQGQADKVFDFLGVARMPVATDLRRNESQALKHPTIKRLANRAYALGPVRTFLNRTLGPEQRSKIKRLILSRNYRKNEAVPPADPAVQSRLQAFYLEDMRRLQAMTGRDLTNWLEKYPVAA